MRSDEPRRGSPAAARAAARIFFRETLAWLRGYPTGRVEAGGLPWMHLPEPGTGEAPARIIIKAEHVRRAAHGVRHLPSRFPRASWSLLDDPVEWRALASRRLDSLGTSVRGRGSLPDLPSLLESSGLGGPDASAILRSIRERPAIAPLATALAWVHGLAPHRLRSALSMVVRRIEPFEATLGTTGGDPLQSAVSLVDLILEEGESHAAFLLDFVGDCRVHKIPLEIGRRGGFVSLSPLIEEALRKRLRWVEQESRGRQEAPPPVDLQDSTVPDPRAPAAGAAALSFAVGLAGDDPAFRRKALRLLRLLLPLSLVDRWDSWWRAWNQKRGEAKEILDSPPTPDSNRALARILKAVQRIESRVPPAWPAEAVLSAVRRWSSDELREVHGPLLRALEKLPAVHGELAVRKLLFLHWDEILRTHRRSASLFGIYLRALASHLDLSSRAGRALLTPLLPQMESRQDSVILCRSDTRILCGNLERGLITPLFAFYEALARRARRGRLRAAMRCFSASDGFAATVLRRARDADQAADLVLAIAGRSNAKEPIGESFTIRLWEWLLEASSGSPRTFADLASNLHAIDWPSLNVGEEALLALARAWPDGAAFTELILAGQARRLLRLADGLAFLRFLIGAQDSVLPALPRDRPVTSTAHGTSSKERASRRPSWLSDLPEALRGPARKMVRLEGTGGARVPRFLAAAVLDRRAIDREIEAIHTLIAGAETRRADSLRRRLENLEARRNAAATTLSPEKIRRIREKIERRIMLAGLQSRESAVTESIHAELSRTLGPVPASWTHDEAILGRIRLALSLRNPRHRDLTRLLLRARLGPPPWDLRHAPENRAFLSRMANAGVDMHPWLDGAPILERAAATGETLRAALEHDPLEVLGMGEPFATCLSPGEGNYFAAVANAVDINKKVLFVRGRGGRALGACPSIHFPLDEDPCS